MPQRAPYTTLTVERFGGLNLSDDPGEVGVAGAVDLLNTDLVSRGMLVARAGYSPWTVAGATSSAIDRVLWAPGLGPSAQNDYVLVYANATLYRQDQAGNSSSVVASPGIQAWVRFGAPGIKRVYIAGSNGLFAVDSSLVFTTVSAAATARFTHLAVSPIDNRIVGAGDSNSTTYASRVSFSDPGLDNVDHASRFVDLTPGDGEVITGMTVWRDYVFVFKKTKFFVFYGVSTLADGSPEFNYRTIHNVGHASEIRRQDEVLSAPEGVYFVATDGIYLTTGSIPLKVSGVLDPYFLGGNVRVFTSTAALQNRRIFHNSPAGQALVYYTDTQQWSKWTLPADSLTVVGAPVGSAAAAYLLFSRPTTDTTHVQKLTGTTDNGVPVSWSYQSGYYAPAGGRRVKLRGSSVWGSGIANLQILARGARVADVADPGATLTLGTAPAVAEAKRRRSCRGVLFAHQLSGTGPATVTRLTHRFLPPGLDS